MKTTKHSLLMSAIALLLSASMLIGTTFAWFTDSVTSSGNIIKSGTLDITLSYLSDKDDPNATDAAWNEITEAEEAIFDYTLWEPGYTEVRHIKIENNGSLALKYLVNFIPKDEQGKIITDLENLKVDGYNLADVIDVYYSDPAKAIADRNSVEGLQYLGTLTEVLSGLADTANGTLVKDDKDIITLALKMKEEAGNEYQGKYIGASFDIQLLATQLNSEEDSFDKNYDVDAEYEKLDTADTWDGTADFELFGLPRNATDSDIENVSLAEDEYIIYTAEELVAFAKLVDAGKNFADKTIKLASNIDLYFEDENKNRVAFNPIGHSANGKSFNGTFDGQGHTISNMYEQSNLDSNNGGWLYEGEYYGLFAYTNGATVKNVTIADAYISSGRNEAAGVVGNAVDTTFSDITISNTTLIAYNNSAGGVAAECYGSCSFTNITVDEDTVIGPLWGTYDVRLGGVVGLVQAGNKVTFSNITVACQLDAINDVAANYQYWLYRYSGMLIGHVDGVNGVADPTGYVTCENVKVIYGDWVNYHYCEDADLGAGSYNGPGEYKYARVEAGTGTGGIDLSACNHNADESHNVLIVFDQLFGGGQGVKGLKTYDGVTVIYPNN